MKIGTYHPSQRNNHVKTVYNGRRCGSVGYYIVHAGRVCPVTDNELATWYRVFDETDWEQCREPVQMEINYGDA